LSEGGECEGRDDAEVVVATFEGFEEEWVGFGGNLEDQTSACYELMAKDVRYVYLRRLLRHAQCYITDAYLEIGDSVCSEA